jgi:hypothetical protein
MIEEHKHFENAYMATIRKYTKHPAKIDENDIEDNELEEPDLDIENVNKSPALERLRGAAPVIPAVDAPVVVPAPKARKTRKGKEIALDGSNITQEDRTDLYEQDVIEMKGNQNPDIVKHPEKKPQLKPSDAKIGETNHKVNAERKTTFLNTQKKAEQEAIDKVIGYKRPKFKLTSRQELLNHFKKTQGKK